MNRLKQLVIALPVIVGLAAACGDEELQAAPAATPRAAVAKVPDAGTLTDATPHYVYNYNPTVKRDPFRSPVDEGASQVVTNASCNEPLCQFDIDQLLLVAVVTGDSNPIAMVEDSSHRGYIVRRGTRVGKQGGKVTQLLRDSIVITEYWTGPDGKVKPNPVSLKLAAEKSSQLDLDLLQNKPYLP